VIENLVNIFTRSFAPWTLYQSSPPFTYSVQPLSCNSAPSSLPTLPRVVPMIARSNDCVFTMSYGHTLENSINPFFDVLRVCPLDPRISRPRRSRQLSDNLQNRVNTLWRCSRQTALRCNAKDLQVLTRRIKSLLCPFFIVGIHNAKIYSRSW